MLIGYADGGKRKGRGAYAFLITDAPKTSIKLDYNGAASGSIIGHGFGIIPDIHSSAQSEIVAASEAAKWIITNRPHEPFMLVSDSTYVVYGFRNPWRMSKNKSHYAHLWNDIIKLTLFSKFETEHVKGHSFHTWNTMCDWICGETLDHDGQRVPRAIHLFNASPRWRSSLIKTNK